MLNKEIKCRAKTVCELTSRHGRTGRRVAHAKELWHGVAMLVGAMAYCQMQYSAWWRWHLIHLAALADCEEAHGVKNSFL